MTKPNLPPISETLLKMGFKLSKKSTKAAIALMIGLGIPALVLWGVASAYIGIAVNWIFTEVALKLEGLSLLSTACIALWGILCLLIYLIIIGGGAGGLFFLLSYWSKSFSSVHAFLLGFIPGIMGTTSFIIIVVYLLDWWGSKSLLNVLSLILGSLTILIGTGIISSVLVDKFPTRYCKTCKKRYGYRDKYYAPISIAEALLHFLKDEQSSGDYQLSLIDNKERPCLKIEVSHCHTCETSDYEILCYLIWNEEIEGRQKEKMILWFDLEIPSNIGILLNSNMPKTMANSLQ